MRKVTKILVKVLSVVILLLIILPVLVSLLLTVPSIQNYAVHRAAEFASEKIGTRVSIDHITIGLLNKVKVRGFYVEDLDCDTLIYAGSVTAYLGGYNAVEKRLIINSGRVEDGKFVLRETSRGTMNVKEVVDRLGRKRKGGFRLLVRSLDVADVDFRLERLSQGRREGVDYDNMRLAGIDSHIDNFEIDGGAVGGEISSMSFAERSGFVLGDLSASHFTVDKGLISFSSLRIETAESDLFLPHLTISGDGWDSYKDFVRNVRIDGLVTDSYASSRDIGFFAPSVRRWQTSIYDATFSMSGTVSDFEAVIKRMKFEGGGILAADARIKGLPDARRSRFEVKVSSFESSTPELLRLLRDIAGLDLPEKAAPYADRTDTVALVGEFKGSLRNFSASADADLGSCGSMSLSCGYSVADGIRMVKASATGNGVDIGRVLGEELLGRASFGVDAEMSFDGGIRSAKGVVSVPSIQLYGADYGDISLNGELKDGRVEATLGSSDAKCTFNALAVADISGEEPQYDAIVNIERADLHAMNINRRDSLSVLSGSVGLSARGRTFDTMNGELSIADAKYLHNGGEVVSELVSVKLSSNEDSRTVNLTSDFADAVFECRARYGDVAYYLKNLLNQYLPDLYDSSTRQVIETKSEGLRRNIALLSVTAKRIDPLLNCFTSGLEVSEGTKLQVFMNPSNNRFVLRAGSDYISKGYYLATELKLNVDNRSDSLAMSLATADLYVGTLHFSHFGLHGGAKDNDMMFTAEFADSVRKASGDFAVSANISRQDSLRRLSMRVLPSQVRHDTKAWNISSGRIEVDSARINIERFSVVSDNQELYIGGVASRSRADSVVMRMSNFELTPFTQIAGRMGYEIEGRTNGYAKVKSALRDSEIDARILLDSIDVNGLRLPDLVLGSKWDLGRSRASLTVSTRETRDTVMRGFYSPSRRRYYARMRTEKLDMGLLDPMLTGVISDTRGRANVDLVLNGSGRNADLSGSIKVSDFATTVDYTKCTYTAPKVEVAVKNNRMTIDGAYVYDSRNRRGVLDMDLNLSHLSNVEYGFGFRLRDMQVLNTTKQDNDMFYGDVYASGNATIRGDKTGVVMDIVAETEEGSQFFMPLSGKSNISNADFVIFESADKPDTTNYLVRKKLMFERRQQRHSSTRGAMDITMALDVRPNAEVQLVIDPTVGDIIKGRGDGSLNMRINPRMNIFEMYGDYTIEEGSYLFTLQNIINKRFIIESGSTIQWTGEPLDAMLNINAAYKLKASLQPLLEGSLTQNNISSRAVPVECIIHLADRLTHPTVTFDVLVPNVDSDVQSVISNALSTPESKSQQFLYLLVANSFISESLSNSASASIGESTAATTGFEVLSNQLSNWLLTEGSNIVIRYRPKTEQMSDEVDIGFSKGLINNRLLIEVEGNYIVDKSQMVNATSNFGGEAYITWLIDKAGTLRLTGFTHTIDRFDENQGLQETGIGIYYKEDFDNAKDLRERIRMRFGGKRRRERSESGFEYSSDEISEAEAMMEAGNDRSVFEDDARAYDDR